MALVGARFWIFVSLKDGVDLLCVLSMSMCIGMVWHEWAFTRARLMDSILMLDQAIFSCGSSELLRGAVGYVVLVQSISEHLGHKCLKSLSSTPNAPSTPMHRPHSGDLLNHPPHPQWPLSIALSRPSLLTRPCPQNSRSEHLLGHADPRPLPALHVADEDRVRLLALSIISISRGRVSEDLSACTALRCLFLQEAVYRVLLLRGQPLSMGEGSVITEMCGF